jgi:hypothetical protein
MNKYAFQTFENLGCNHHLGLYHLWLLDFLKSAVFSKRRHHHKFFWISQSMVLCNSLEYIYQIAEKTPQ